MEIPPTSHLPRSDERLVGLITLQLLDSWRVWVKRRVESVAFPDVATQTRHISVDFELPLAVLDAVDRSYRVQSDGDPDNAPEGTVDDVWVARARRGHPDGLGERANFVLVPLTVLKKQGLTRFSLRDESATALPLLTRDQTGAVATAVLVTFAEGLCNTLDDDDDTGADLPPALRAELFNIATLPPIEATAVWDRLDQHKPDESDRCARWRRTLVESPRFMSMALDLAQNFLLLTRVTSEPGRRRIIKISYEHHVEVPPSTAATVSGRLRRVRRWIGWGAYTEQIQTPAVGLGRCFHLEVEAPEGIQATRARLTLQPRSSEKIAPVRSYPDFPEAVSNGKQRVHLHVSVPSSYTGQATVYLRPRPSTIVRAAVITAALTTVLLTVVALRPSSFQTNLGAAAALLLLVPGGLAGYVARPREPHVATQLILGLRLLALSCGLWAFLAAGTLVAGRRCPDMTMPGSGCEYWSETGYVIGGLAGCALVTLLVLIKTLRNTSRPPEQEPM